MDRSLALAGSVLMVLQFPVTPAATSEPGTAQGRSGPSARAASGTPDSRTTPPGGRTRVTWSRVRIPDPIVATLVRRALDEASHLLSEPGCVALLDDFRDVNGRLLSERVAALDMDIRQYLELVVFIDGSQSQHCGDMVAFTAPGSRVVRLCLRSVEQSWRENHDRFVASLIHEVLHTLGLGENPPSPAEITERVLRRCRGQERR